MEAIACLLLLLTSRWHRFGFSHSEFENCRSVYFLSEKENLEVFIDGSATGILAPGMVYFPESKTNIFVEFRCEGLTFFAKEIQLDGPKTMVWGQLTPVIHQMA